MPHSSFDRARHFCRPTRAASLFIYTLSALSAVLVVLLLITSGVIVHLFVHRGTFDVPLNERESVEEWVVRPAEKVTAGRAFYEYRGLAAFVYEARDYNAANWLQRIYQQSGMLQTNQRCLVALLAVWLAIVVVDGLILFVLDRVIQWSVERGVTDLRIALHQQAMQVGTADILSGKRAGSVELFTENTEAVRRALVTRWRLLPRKAIVVVACLALALLIHLPLSLLLVAAAVLVTALATLSLSQLQKRTKPRRALLGDRAAHQMNRLTESLRLVWLVRGFLLSDTPGQPFEQSLDHYRRIAQKRDAVESTQQPLSQLILAAGIALTAWLVGVNLLRQPPSIGISKSFVLYAALVYAWFPLIQLWRLRSVGERAARSAEAIFEYLDREPQVGQVPGAKDLPRDAAEISFTSVTIADRSGRKLLDDVSLKVAEGSRVAVVSTDPAVPMAIGCLMARFFDPDEGSVLLGTHDIRYATLASLRERTALVLQDGMLFTGTVAENISCGDPRYTLRHVTEAARRAGADEFIHDLPQGFDTIVGDHGIRLGASEVFRISLARALLRRPNVLILQEPGGDVDDKTAELIDQSMRKVARKRTLLILPARVLTTRFVDRVLVFDQGKLVADGSHTELLQSSELYRHLHYLQFNPFTGKPG